MFVSFVNSENIRKAYLGKHAQSLVLKSSAQVEDLYAARGILIPVEVSSTLQFLAGRPGSSLSDIARALDIPHQLASQRVEKLRKLALVGKRSDPTDRRRFEYHLNASGQEQAQLLIVCMEDTAEVYSDLYDEIECDLAQALIDAISALERKSLLQRFAEKYGTERVDS